ncbi:MAG: transketolase family protein, partial [Chloroflexota bacterium]
GVDGFGQRFPDRLFNFGIAEQNAVMSAAGLASAGAIPFVASYAVFLSMRTLEQLRTFVAYPHLNVKILAGLGGYSAGINGVTHAATEDLSILRSIPGMTVLCPADAVGIEKAIYAAAGHQGPVYIRLGMAVPAVHGPDYPFRIGRAVPLRTEGRDAAIVACGYMVSRALEAVDRLAAEGLRVQMLEMPTLKPIDREAIVRLARETGAIVTVEENNVIGGLGSAVAEVLGEAIPTPMERVGIADCYADTGSQDELLERFGLTVPHIVESVRRVVARKG